MLRRTVFSLPLLPVLRAAEPTGSGLQEAVGREIAGFKGTVCLFAKNLDTGLTLGLRENEPIRTASTIKLPIMVAVFSLVEAGKARWDELLPLRDDDKVSGSGVLSELSGGVKLPLRDLVRLMIVVSDNTATNLILDRITTDAVNECMDSMGLSRTRSLRKVRGDGSALKPAEGWSKAGLLEENKRFGIGVSTSREMVSLLEKIERGEAVSPAASREMVAILRRQQYKDGIGRRLGKYQVASKSGALDALRSDAGIVYTPKGRIAISITADGMPAVDYSQDNPGLLLIARLAEILVEGLSR